MTEPRQREHVTALTPAPAMTRARLPLTMRVLTHPLLILGAAALAGAVEIFALWKCRRQRQR